MKNTVIEFEYENLDDITELMYFCDMSEINLKTLQHTKMKNYVMNNLYLADELNDSDKVLFTFIYDYKSQQKYLPWIQVTQEKLATMLGKSKSSISKSLKNLIQYNLIIKAKNRYGETIFIPNENIKTWWTAIDMQRLSLLEETRKHTASSNKQLTDEYNIHKNMKQ